jgi:D-alanine-D-alanine ligase
LVAGLRDARFPVETIRVEQFLSDPKGLVGRVDFVVNMSKGLRGPFKKSLVPAILDYLGIPYLGSDPYVLSFVRNKAHLKAFAAHIGIPTPEFALVRDIADMRGLTLPPFPLFVKPCHESSSIGIDEKSHVTTEDGLLSAVRRIIDLYKQPAIVESFLSGAEYSVPIIGTARPEAQGVVELLTEDGTSLDGRCLVSEVVARYRYGLRYPVATPAADEMVRYALMLYHAVGFRDYGRVDFRLDGEGHPFLLEASTHPHIAKHSDFYKVWESRGLSHTQLLEHLVRSSLGRCGIVA